MFGECSTDEICAAKDAGEDITYKVDESYEHFMNNWYLNMDLMCKPITAVAQIFSWVLIGVLIGILFAPLSERIGRKKAVILGMIFSIIAQLLILFFSSIAVRTVGFFLIGLTCNKNSIACVWGSECVPLAGRSKVFSIINVVDCTPPLIFGLYCLFISRDWYPIYLATVIVNVIGLLLVLILPESPRWLIYGNKREEAIKQINYMAWFNGNDKETYIPEDATFEETAKVAE